jgi:hypothetical protein
MELFVIAIVDGKPLLQETTFCFPHTDNSVIAPTCLSYSPLIIRLQPSLGALNKYLKSSQLNSDLMPSVMEEEAALAMTPSDFQSRVNEGPVVLVGPSGSTTFNIPTLYRLVGFSSYVDCIGKFHFTSFCCTHQASLDSDTLALGEDEETLRMTAKEVANEICHWQTSRPLIMTTASRYTHVYQEVER